MKPDDVPTIRLPRGVSGEDLRREHPHRWNGRNAERGVRTIANRSRALKGRKLNTTLEEDGTQCAGS